MNREDILDHLLTYSAGSQIGKSVIPPNLDQLIKELTETLERLEDEHIERTMMKITSTDKHGREII